MASDAAPPPLLLAFDTSAAQCAAALVRSGRLLATRTEAMDRGQAERLLPLLEEILAEAGVAWSDLDGLAVVLRGAQARGDRVDPLAGAGTDAAGAGASDDDSDPHGGANPSRTGPIPRSDGSSVPWTGAHRPVD